MPLESQAVSSAARTAGTTSEATDVDRNRRNSTVRRRFSSVGVSVSRSRCNRLARWATVRGVSSAGRAPAQSWAHAVTGLRRRPSQYWTLASEGLLSRRLHGLRKRGPRHSFGEPALALEASGFDTRQHVGTWIAQVGVPCG